MEANPCLVEVERWNHINCGKAMPIVSPNTGDFMSLTESSSQENHSWELRVAVGLCVFDGVCCIDF